jgi:amino acid transporter
LASPRESRPDVPPPHAPPGDYGLRSKVLSPLEVLGQSVSGIAPTLTPAITIPLVFQLSGNGTWLAYVLATFGILLVAWCIGQFARHSAAPGSLYSYAAGTLPPWLAAVVAWSLFLAYIATASSSIGGFYHYCGIFLRRGGEPVFAVLIAAFMTWVSMWISWRDVKLSARLMFWIEAISVFMIFIVVMLVLVRHGFRVDTDQLRLRGVTPSGFRFGLVLALYSFAGFESSTAMGVEAQNPFHTIPRAVLQSAILAGAFFTLCSYAETLGLRTAGADLGSSQSPFHVLSVVGGVPFFGALIDICLVVSLFSGALACITAGSRVLLQMAHDGLLPGQLRKTHRHHRTPHRAIAISGAASLLPAAILAARGDSGLDVYGWLGSLGTYGFIAAYGLVSLAVFIALRDRSVPGLEARIIPIAAVVAMVLTFLGTLYSLPAGPYGKLPFVYLAYLATGMIWFAFRRRRSEAK